MGRFIFELRNDTNPNGSIKLDADGRPVYITPTEPWVTLPSSCVSSEAPWQTGVAFDDVGTIGWELVATCPSGDVFRIKANKIATLITNIGGEGGVAGPFEGVTVAPASFFPYGGNIIVAAENAFAGEFKPTGVVFAVSAFGVVNTVIDVPTAESMAKNPGVKCSFSSTAAFTYFLAAFRNGGGSIHQISKGSAFAGTAEKLFVTSESGPSIGIWVLNPGTPIDGSGTPVTKTPFRSFDYSTQHPEGHAFVDCRVPVLVAIDVNRGPVFTSVTVHSSRHFNALRMIDSTARWKAAEDPGPGTPAIGQCRRRGGGGGEDDRGGVKKAKKDDDEKGEKEARARTNNDDDDNDIDGRGKKARRGDTTCRFLSTVPPGVLGKIEFKFNDLTPGDDGEADGGG